MVLVVSVLLGSRICDTASPMADVIRITSDRLEANQQERQVTFLGNVVATKGDLKIQGDRMTIHYQEGVAAGRNSHNLAESVDTAVVDGNVRIFRENTVVTAGHAIYYLSENKIVLTGEPRVQRDKDFIQGSSITYFLESEKSVVEGGPAGPVEATIYGAETVASSNKSSVERAGRSGTGSDEGG